MEEGLLLDRVRVGGDGLAVHDGREMASAVPANAADSGTARPDQATMGAGHTADRVAIDQPQQGGVVRA